MDAGQLLEWMTHHHLPLQLFQEEDGMWVLADNSTNTVMGSGESAEVALQEAYVWRNKNET